MKKDTGTIVTPRKRKSGIPTGNAGEYFVMAELLRRGFDAQLADRNTKGYDLLVGRPKDKKLSKVQVKSVRSPPWYVKVPSFTGDLRGQTTVYVLLGKEDARKPVRYFVAKNRTLASKFYKPANWKQNAFMSLKAVEKYESRWDIL
jgi:hypothetical protein